MLRAATLKPRSGRDLARDPSELGIGSPRARREFARSVGVVRVVMVGAGPRARPRHHAVFPRCGPEVTVTRQPPSTCTPPSVGPMAASGRCTAPVGPVSARSCARRLSSPPPPWVRSPVRCPPCRRSRRPRRCRAMPVAAVADTSVPAPTAPNHDDGQGRPDAVADAAVAALAALKNRPASVAPAALPLVDGSRPQLRRPARHRSRPAAVQSGQGVTGLRQGVHR